MEETNLDKILIEELALNEFMPAETVGGAIAQLSIVTIGFLAMFIISGAPEAIIDRVVTAIKNRKITSQRIERLVRDMKIVGLDPKKITDPAHTAIFTKVIKKLMKAESTTETEAAEKELKQMLSDFWPYQRGQIRDTMNKMSKENQISLAHKIKYFFSFKQDEN
jgi:hypothetical protein